MSERRYSQAPIKLLTVSHHAFEASEAAAAGASVSGIPGLTIDSQNLTVLVNRPDSSGTTMNLAADPLNVISGPGRSVTLDFASSAGPLVQASGTMNISVENFFTLSGKYVYAQWLLVRRLEYQRHHIWCRSNVSIIRNCQW